MNSGNDVIGLGIETSCDETSVAVVRNGKEILSNIIYSQIPEHAPFRGVVPEIAGRSHLIRINGIFENALEEAGVSAQSMDYCAVSNRPGLLGSLMMGGLLAKSLNLVHGIPSVPVDHLEAHLHAVSLEPGDFPEYPFLGLLLSGGNSAIFRVDGPGDIKKIADTTDDALGEAFDKVASILYLPYPGGPYVEKCAVEYDGQEENSLFPPLLRNRPATDLRFSFSGIKTAVLRASRAGEPAGRICRDFQNTAFELIERILIRSVKKTDIRRVVASGGVLANESLRNRLDDIARRKGLTLRYPVSRKLCTDNGAMVAALGYHLYQSGLKAELNFDVSSKRE